MRHLQDINLAIIGLGYVGLPLAVEFGKKRAVVGFDINQPRIAALQAGHDSTLEVSDAEMAEARRMHELRDRKHAVQQRLRVAKSRGPFEM